MPFTPDKPTPGFKPDTPYDNGQQSGNQRIASLGESTFAQIPSGDFKPDNQGFMQNAKNLYNMDINSPQIQSQLKEGAKHPSTGMEDPVYNALGMTSEAPIWALAKYIPGIRGLLKPAAARSGVVDLVKNEAELGPAVANKVGEATEQFNKSQIAPRMLEQQARASEQVVPFNANDFKGIHPRVDQIVDQMAQGGVKEVPMKEALSLRALLNDKSLFRDLGPYSPEVAAKSQKAFDAGNKLRTVLGEADPNIPLLSEEMKDAYKLRDAATKGVAKRPISTVEAPIGSDKASLLSQFDKAAGTDLRQYGQDISTAKERLGQGFGDWAPTSSKAMLKRLLGVVPRTYDATAQGVLNTINKNKGLMSIIPAKVGSKPFDTGE